MNRHIVEKSGLLNYILPGDILMAFEITVQ